MQLQKEIKIVPLWTSSASGHHPVFACECISLRVTKLIQDLTMSQSSRPCSFFQSASSRVKGLFKESFIHDTKLFNLLNGSFRAFLRICKCLALFLLFKFYSRFGQMLNRLVFIYCFFFLLISVLKSNAKVIKHFKMQILSCVSAGLSLDYASAGNLHSNLQQNQKLLQNAMLQPFT